MKIPISVLNLHFVAAKESSRYAINAINFRRTADGECFAEVTDGRRLVQASWGGLDDDGTGAFSCLLHSGMAIAALQFCTAAKGDGLPPFVVLAESDNDITLTINAAGVGATFTCEAEPGKFPKVDGVIPDYSKGERTESPLAQAARCSMDISLFMELLTAVQSVLATDERVVCKATIPHDIKKPLMLRAVSEASWGKLTVVAVQLPCVDKNS